MSKHRAVSEGPEQGGGRRTRASRARSQVRADRGQQCTAEREQREREQLEREAHESREAATVPSMSECDHLVEQMREANERLVIAMLRADELVEEATLARAQAAHGAAVQAEARERAESLAAQLRSSEEALRASASEAHAVNRAKDEFVAMLGHELRAPLAPMLIALDLIAMDGSDAHRREHTIIERQVRHLVRLVDDLLDVSRIRSGKITLDRRPTELAEVAARALELASPLIESKHHNVTVDVPRGLVVDGDVHRLAQAAANLLTNAAKYTPAGGSILVKGERRDAMLLLRVRDTGIGISQAMLPRIFDMFAQERQALDRAQGGLGLGLAIVRSLVAMHGGTVTVHSEGVGRGSEFVIELPAPRGAADADHITDSVAAAASRRILVIEDEDDAASLMADILTTVGHDVRVANDGASALAIIDRFTPEIVLLDIGLPVMDGYEVARRLRAALASHDVHFIALSGYGQPVDRRHSAEAGFDAHLVKPIDLATLQHTIADVRRR